MRNRLLITVLCAGLLATLTTGWLARAEERPAQGGHDAKHIVLRPGELQWQSGPASLPRGVEYVVLEGDPAKEGMFTMRLRAPDGYRIPPHTHPKIERVTVLKGTFRLGTGAEFNEQEMQELPAGSFFAMPVGMQHFAATEGETIVQLNGLGPWDINYIDPADDPRNGDRAQPAAAREQ